MEKFNKTKDSIINEFQNTYDKIKINPQILLVPFLIIILFTIIGYILFNKQMKSILNDKFKLNHEFVNKENNNTKNVIIYFYTEWCPYCKKSKPQWNDFKDLVELQSYKDKFTFQEVDCDKETAMADNYKIEGYPTIKFIYNGEVYDYDAKPDSKLLLQFVESIINDN
jgi:thiol-disulfide isomerase/thioredoxin